LHGLGNGEIVTPQGRAAFASFNPTLGPNMATAFELAYEKALGLHREGHLIEADRLYQKALALKPDLVEALNNRGAIQQLFGNWKGALACYDRALAIRPNYGEALANRGNVLIQLRHYEEALRSFESALALMPGRGSALNGRAGTLLKLKRYEEALAAYDALRAADPANPYALGGILMAAMNLCDWATTARIAPEVEAAITQGTAVVSPFLFLGFSGDKALQRKCASNAIAEKGLASTQPLWRGQAYGHDRVRLAYLSSDFCQHPVGLLSASLIERHDRVRFEVLGISTGPHDNSAIRARLEKGFDRFFEVSGQGPSSIAALLRELEVDILIDLTGHTEGDHFEILSHRPCPVQVNYLGYPATCGTASLDYILADPVVAPFADQPFFSERIVQLPGCYFPTSYDVLAPAPSRASAGLAQQAFVFCSFNNSWKITRDMFETWVRLLKAIPGSLLWLLETSSGFRDRLRHEAKLRGIAPERLVFAPRLPPQEHLARQELADLVLDTAPYNGHMTTSDALWAGVPLVTLRGHAFAGRVAASMLQVMGFSELVTDSLADYEALALTLAQEPTMLAGLREKLAANRKTKALFDVDGLRQSVEGAFLAMLEISQKKQAPRSFRVGYEGT
jgi:protein O-GlcNAc transferase